MVVALALVLVAADVAAAVTVKAVTVIQGKIWYQWVR